MTVERDHQGGMLTLACEECGVVLDKDFFDDAGGFQAAIRFARQCGWKLEQVDGTWEHTCDDCSAPGSRLEAAKRLFGKKTKTYDPDIEELL